jgi:hypothetical protein
LLYASVNEAGIAFIDNCRNGQNIVHVRLRNTGAPAIVWRGARIRRPAWGGSRPGGDRA